MLHILWQNYNKKDTPAGAPHILIDDTAGCHGRVKMVGAQVAVTPFMLKTIHHFFGGVLTCVFFYMFNLVFT